MGSGKYGAAPRAAPRARASGTGRIVGSLAKSEKWVSLGGDVATVGIAPRGKYGLAVTLSLRF